MTTKTNPLLAAADYIAENGWCRNTWYNEKGQACLAGAVGIVTGALVPLTEKETARFLKTYVNDYGYTEAAAEKEIPRHKWSRAKAKLSAYVDAITALAGEIDASATEDATKRFVASVYEWEPNEAERERMATQGRRARLEGIVVTRNDRGNEGDDQPRTTKAQAIKLLKRAAERV